MKILFPGTGHHTCVNGKKKKILGLQSTESTKTLHFTTLSYNEHKMHMHAHPHTTKRAILRMYSTSSYKTLSILHYRAPVAFMKYFAFQSCDDEFHNRNIIVLHWLIGWLNHTQTQKDIQYAEGNDDLFSIPSNTGERPLPILAWQCTGGHNSAPFISCVCVNVCVHACEAKQRRVTL